LIPPYTVPEIFRTPLEDTVLQILLLEETLSSSPTAIISWFDNLIEPPNRPSVVHAAGHLMEIGEAERGAKEGWSEGRLERRKTLYSIAQ